MVKGCCIEKDQDEALSSTSPYQLESDEGSEGLDADDVVPGTSPPHPGHSSAKIATKGFDFKTSADDTPKPCSCNIAHV